MKKEEIVSFERGFSSGNFVSIFKSIIQANFLGQFALSECNRLATCSGADAGGILETKVQQGGIRENAIFGSVRSFNATRAARRCFGDFFSLAGSQGGPEGGSFAECAAPRPATIREGSRVFLWWPPTLYPYFISSLFYYLQFNPKIYLYQKNFNFNQ